VVARDRVKLETLFHAATCTHSKYTFDRYVFSFDFVDWDAYVIIGTSVTVAITRLLTRPRVRDSRRKIRNAHVITILLGIMYTMTESYAHDRTV